MLKKSVCLMGSMRIVIPPLMAITRVSLLEVIVAQGLPTGEYLKSGIPLSALSVNRGIDRVFSTTAGFTLAVLTFLAGHHGL